MSQYEIFFEVIRANRRFQMTKDPAARAAVVEGINALRAQGVEVILTPNGGTMARA
jgi:hypothetical protein